MNNIPFKIDLKDKKPLILVGSPNVGKSVVFSLLTSQYVTVSNYPGTTVEVASATSNFTHHKYLVLDTPGINSLVPYSEDEKVTRDILFRYPDKTPPLDPSLRPLLKGYEESLPFRVKGIGKVYSSGSKVSGGSTCARKGIPADKTPPLEVLGGSIPVDKTVVHVFDSKNFVNNLMLTLQLIEMGAPLVLDLNMIDEATNRGIKIDVQKLSEELGIGVAATVAVEKTGLHNLLDEIACARTSEFRIDYGIKIETAIEKITQLLPVLSIPKRLAALLFLANDITFKAYLIQQSVTEDVLEKIEDIVRMAQKDFAKPLQSVIIERRHKIAQSIFKKVVTFSKVVSSRISDKIGRLMVSPIWGFPIAALVMYITYLFVGKFGAGFLVNIIEERFFNSFLNPAITSIVDRFLPFVFLKDLLVGEYGIITMAITYSFAIILPIVTTFFIVFGILEDTGYLPRLAAVVNRLFKFIGLHGKAVLPFILGLGCGTMAVLTTRILETKRERILAILLLSLVIPCSAQLGVILGMLSTISVRLVFIWLSILLLILGLVGFVASKIIKGELSEFMLELPPVRIPQITNILTKVGARLAWYLKEAVPLFILGTLLLFILDKTNLLAAVRDFCSPVVVNFLNLPTEATEAFIVGFLRRDYGAAGLYALQKKGMLSNLQVLVSVLTITLLVPCVAQFFVMIKERGFKIAFAIFIFVFIFAVLAGGLVNFIFKYFSIPI